MDIIIVRVSRITAGLMMAGLAAFLTIFGFLYPGQLTDLLGWSDDIETASPPDSIASILETKGLHKPLRQPRLVVSKHLLTLTLYEGTDPIKTYIAAIGSKSMQGNKEMEGDLRTPEGSYIIAEKHRVFPPWGFLGSRWLHISYPSPNDAQRGLKNGIITPGQYQTIVECLQKSPLAPQATPLGGDIGVHGGHSADKSSFWTEGCVALFNRDVEELYDYVPVGTPIIIAP